MVTVVVAVVVVVTVVVAVVVAVAPLFVSPSSVWIPSLVMPVENTH